MAIIILSHFPSFLSAFLFVAICTCITVYENNTVVHLLLLGDDNFSTNLILFSFSFQNICQTMKFHTCKCTITVETPE